MRMPDLSGYRDFVDVRDVARAIQAAAVSAATGVINIGSGHAVRAREAAQLLVRASGFEGSVVEENRQVVLPAQAGGPVEHLPGHVSAHHLPGHRPAEPRPGEGRAPAGSRCRGGRPMCGPPGTVSAGGHRCRWRSRWGTSGWRRPAGSESVVPPRPGAVRAAAAPGTRCFRAPERSAATVPGPGAWSHHPARPVSSLGRAVSEYRGGVTLLA